MDQDKIGKFIKDMRKKEGLTQEQFASKYGVTYQAVSKWENGKNIPDITILKQMCKEYKVDINNLLDATENITNKNKKIIFISLLVIAVVCIIVCLFLILNKSDNDFYLKTLSTTCDNFNLYGSIAYNNNKTSIHISNISYCGDKDENKYKQIECTLYELNDDTKTKISSYVYSEKSTISLEEFLKSVNLNVDHYSESCKMYKKNGMYLEISATNINNQTILYKIPLELEENCDDYISTLS